MPAITFTKELVKQIKSVVKNYHSPSAVLAITGFDGEAQEDWLGLQWRETHPITGEWENRDLRVPLEARFPVTNYSGIGTDNYRSGAYYIRIDNRTLFTLASIIREGDTLEAALEVTDFVHTNEHKEFTPPIANAFGRLDVYRVRGRVSYPQSIARLNTEPFNHYGSKVNTPCA